MDKTGLALPRSFCWNENCPDYGKIDHGNIRGFGHTAKGTQRYQCRTCQKTFVETKGTLFYGRHHSQDTILECLAWLAERCSLAAIHRVKGIKEETVASWLQEAAKHVEEIEALLMANYQLTRAQLDAMWTYVGHKGKRGARGTRRSRILLARHSNRDRHTLACRSSLWQRRERGGSRVDGPAEGSWTP